MPNKVYKYYRDSHLKYERSPKGREKCIKRAKKYLGAKREFVQNAKKNPCMDCGKQYHYSIMEFDHRPGEEKKFGVNSKARFSTIDKIKEEMAKCDLVCVLCHKVRTWNRSHLEDLISIN